MHSLNTYRDNSCHYWLYWATSTANTPIFEPTCPVWIYLKIFLWSCPVWRNSCSCFDLLAWRWFCLLVVFNSLNYLNSSIWISCGYLLFSYYDCPRLLFSFLASFVMKKMTVLISYRVQQFPFSKRRGFRSVECRCQLFTHECKLVILFLHFDFVHFEQSACFSFCYPNKVQSKFLTVIIAWSQPVGSTCFP